MNKTESRNNNTNKSRQKPGDCKWWDWKTVESEARKREGIKARQMEERGAGKKNENLVTVTNERMKENMAGEGSGGEGEREKKKKRRQKLEKLTEKMWKEEVNLLNRRLGR